MAQSEGSPAFGAMNGVDTQSAHRSLKRLVCVTSRFSALSAQAVELITIRAAFVLFNSLCIHPPEIPTLSSHRTCSDITNPVSFWFRQAPELRDCKKAYIGRNSDRHCVWERYLQHDGSASSRGNEAKP